MKKESFADKIAKKTFESDSFQKSWQVHMQAFGPILAPAFQEDYQTLVHLAAALNKISRRDIKGGFEKLKQIQKNCETDADKAAWSFFVGLCFEMAGDRERMSELYQDANSFGHSFYLPYLKIAKKEHNDGLFGIAEENYRKAISCLEGNSVDQKSKVILSSVWTNLCACLTMMHELLAAEQALEMSKSISDSQPGRNAVEAILRAAMGQAERVEELLAAVAAESQPMMEQTRKATDDILSGKHPHFHAIPFETAPLDDFWRWFESNRTELEEKLSRQEYVDVITAVCDALKPLAPFTEREPEFGIMPMDGCYRLELVDFHVIALHEVYEELIRRMPETVKGVWEISIVR